MKIVYRAFDGTEFFDEELCKKYEIENAKFPSNVKFYDQMGDSTDAPLAAWFIINEDNLEQEDYNKVVSWLGEDESKGYNNYRGLYTWDMEQKRYTYFSVGHVKNLERVIQKIR